MLGRRLAKLQYRTLRVEIRNRFIGRACNPITKPGQISASNRTYETFLGSVSDHPDLHRDLLNWAIGVRGNSSVSFGEGNQFPSWSFTVCLPSGKHVTLFGVYPDSTVWLQPQSLPEPLGALYRESLKSVVDEREFSKQWFYRKNAIVDFPFIGILKGAIEKMLAAVSASG